MNRFVSVVFCIVILLGAIGTSSVSASGHHGHKKPPASSTAQDITVWVNLDSGIYHYPGTRWYGKSKNGTFIKEKDAIKTGYRAAENGQ